MPVTHHSIFYWPDGLPDMQPTVSKHERQLTQLQTCIKKPKET